MGIVAAASAVKGVLFFGGYQHDYPRSSVLRLGLSRLGIPVYECHADHHLRAWLRYPLLLARFRRYRDCDVVLVPEFRHKDVPLAALLARRIGALCAFDPLVSRYDTRVHDRGDTGDGTLQAWHNRNLDRWSLSLPDVVFADTKEHAKYLAALSPPDQHLGVLPVGCDDITFTPLASPAHKGTRVLFYGNYAPLHGAGVIAGAASILRDRLDIEIDMVGQGQTRAPAEAIAARGGARVRFHDRVAFAELPRWIAAADICLGIFGDTDKAARVVPNKVYQCMAMNRAVIAQDSPAMREVFRDGEDVVLTRAGDAAALADAILRLAGDRDLRLRIGHAGGERVRADFTPQQIAGRFVTICDQAVADGRGGA